MPDGLAGDPLRAARLRVGIVLLLPVAFHLAFNAINTAPFAVTMDIGAFVILIAAEWALGLLVLPGLRDSLSWTAGVPATT